MENLTPLMVMMLRDYGKLPDVPNPPQPGILGFRKPGLREMEALTWVAEWEGTQRDGNGLRTVSGLAAYRDLYDFHTASDVREIVYFAGSPRAVVDIVRSIITQAYACGRRTIGALDLSNTKMERLMTEVGGKSTRVVLEYVCQGF